ncbi:hypothetical protein [Psychroflexus tropicus]|nr:hypothetical protein [Psychroflexus tropicus]
MKKIILIIVIIAVTSFSDYLESNPLSDPTPSENEEPKAHLKDIKKNE